ncbi:MAG: hypothetical protein ACRD0K_26995 [Egibacteraceae bacterium]
MWALLSRRLRQWAILAVAVPLGAKVLQRVGTELEERRGPSNVSRGLKRGGEWVHGVTGGRQRHR